MRIVSKEQLEELLEGPKPLVRRWLWLTFLVAVGAAIGFGVQAFFGHGPWG